MYNLFWGQSKYFRLGKISILSFSAFFELFTYFLLGLTFPRILHVIQTWLLRLDDCRTSNLHPEHSIEPWIIGPTVLVRSVVSKFGPILFGPVRGPKCNGPFRGLLFFRTHLVLRRYLVRSEIFPGFFLNWKEKNGPDQLGAVRKIRTKSTGHGLDQNPGPHATEQFRFGKYLMRNEFVWWVISVTHLVIWFCQFFSLKRVQKNS